MGTHISGKNGGIYSEALVVENCEDTWEEGTPTGCTDEAITDCKVGTYAARVTTDATAIADQVLMSEVIPAGAARDLSTYQAIIFWARSNVAALTADDLKLQISESALCATPAESLALPALTANTWQWCFALFTGGTTTRDVIISVGLYQDTDLGVGTFDIDDVEALKEDQGIKSWTLDYTSDTLETTDFADTGTRSYIAGCNGWSGSFEGFKDGAPLSIGSEVYLVLGETNTAGQQWIGKIVITGAHASVSFDGLVSYSYDFTGNGELQVPSV